MDFIGLFFIVLGIGVFVMFLDKDIRLYGSAGLGFFSGDLAAKKKYHDSRDNTFDRCFLLFLSISYISIGVAHLIYEL